MAVGASRILRWCVVPVARDPIVPLPMLMPVCLNMVMVLWVTMQSAACTNAHATTHCHHLVSVSDTVTFLAVRYAVPFS